MKRITKQERNRKREVGRARCLTFAKYERNTREKEENIINEMNVKESNMTVSRKNVRMVSMVFYLIIVV